MIEKEQTTQTEENLYSQLVDSTKDVIISTELINLSQSVHKYCITMSKKMATMEDFDKVDKFPEAFFRGWHLWKQGQEEKAFQTFRDTMSSN